MAPSRLALHGGVPTIKTKFARYQSLGREEDLAVQRVLRRGVLSGFVAGDGDGSNGGEEVQALESEVAQMFDVEHCISTNSWTSGLECIIGSLQVDPGDEVITSPWTMAATATAALHHDLVPIFADISPETFNIDPNAVVDLITPRTRAIIAPDIFGQSAEVEVLMRIADRHGLWVVSDSAQSPFATRFGKLAGTQSHIGGLSLNHHKHINCGEGGLILTNSKDLATRSRGLRNHREVIANAHEFDAPVHSMAGHNFRLGELEAAIARSQMRKLARQVGTRIRAAEQLTEGLSDLEGIKLPYVDPANKHVFYVYGIVLEDGFPVKRNQLVHALQAEGVPSLFEGYQNLHRLPVFEARYLQTRLPRSASPVARSCPTAELLHDQRFLGVNMCAHEYSPDEVEQMIRAFKKVWGQLDKLAT